MIAVACNSSALAWATDCRYSFDDESKPSIKAINGQMPSEQSTPVLGYNQAFTLEWEPFQADAQGVNVTSVVLVAPSATTHSYNMNQRVVVLQVLGSGAPGLLTVKTPHDIATAPPQLYMMFALNGKTYGPSQWIKLVPGAPGEYISIHAFTQTATKLDGFPDWS
jgi:hypothetical protein